MSASRRDRDERARGRVREPHPREDYDDEYEDTEYEEESPAEAPARRRRPAERASAGMSAVEAAEAALRQITEVTAKSAEGVTSVGPAQGGWNVGVELIEAHRIPSSSDILALYQVEIDADGKLRSYNRIRRYPRGRSEAS